MTSAKPSTATGRANRCDCVLTFEVILWVVLAMGLLTDLPIRQVFKHARRLRAGETSPGRSNLCMARRRLGVAPVRHLFGQVVRPLARPETPGAFYHGLRLMGIDGVVLDVPDSAANAAAFGRPSAGPRGDGAFPQVKKLSLVELGTHAEVAFVVRPGGSDERAMVAGLLGHLMPGMLLLLDRAFFSYERWRRLEATGVKLLARVQVDDPAADPPADRRLVPGQDLPQRLRPAEGPRRGRGAGDPVHARRPAAGRPRRGARPDHEPAR